MNAIASPPAAAVREQRDAYFGETVVDPYRWMEDSTEELTSWLRAQAAFTRATLDATPLQRALSERVRALNDAGPDVKEVTARGSQLFYLKRSASEQVHSLWVRDLSTQHERMVLDPGQRATGGVSYSIDYFEPSPDGSLLAVGISPRGSEQAVIHIVQVADGRELPDVIDRARYAFPSWQPDGRSFFYKRDRLLAEGAPESERILKARIYLHTLGSDPERDPAVFGYGVSPRIEIAAEAWPFVDSSLSSDYLIAGLSDGVRKERTLYAAPRSQLRAAQTPWRRIAVPDDRILGYEAHGDRLYALTTRDAPRAKLVQISLTHVDLAHAPDVVPASDKVVRDTILAQDALYVRLLDRGLSRIERVPLAGGTPSTLALPYEGAVSDITASPTTRGLWFRLESWTRSPRLFHFDPDTQQITDTGVIPASPIDFSDITAQEVSVVSRDGTQVPLSIVRRKASTPQPTLLEAYGAYGHVYEPKFDPMSLAWLERGGVSAVCHPRGGGELGEVWHEAGILDRKPNTIADVEACAQYLIAQGMATTKQLAIEGVSAGAIAAAGAFTRQPELFGAAVLRVGMTNALRFEQLPIGPLNVWEFGSVASEKGYKMLREIDAYHHVRSGARYPAVLLTTGLTDPRVSPWQPAKLAARLQAATASAKPVLLRVDTDTGHGTGSARARLEEARADKYAFLFWQLEAAH